MDEHLGPYKLGPFDTENWGIYTGDARELSEAIPDESVDLVFTDPIYQNIEDYEWLAQTAARVLKPDRACLVWCGIGYLPETLDALRAGGLTYRWQGIVRTVARVKKMYCDMGWSIYATMLWMEKGRMKARRSRDLITVPYRENSRTKQYAWTWGKPVRAVSTWLDSYSQLDDIVIDFFAGSGTVPAVCRMLNRRWLAFEIEPKTAKLARQRIAQTQPPLNLPMPEQMALDLTERI